MDATAVATAFIRHRGDVVLLLRSGEARAYSDRWGTVVARIDSGAESAARRGLREQTGSDPEEATLVRAGEPFRTDETALADQLVVYPFLFDVERRDVETNWEIRSFEWVPPTALLGRETVPELWRAYDRVRPTVGAIEADTDHGSTWLSMRALEVLRDEAGLLASDRTSEYDDTAAIARTLVDARPTMTAVRNRVLRAMTDARDESPQAVEKAAHDNIQRALRADSEAADAMASDVAGTAVATLSLSGTVLQALQAGTAESVLVAESRPGREGVAVAETLAPTTDVTLTTDAGFTHQLPRQDIDLLVVGADSVLPDGRVVNKVGTRSAAIAAQHEDVTVLVATASAKIRPGADGAGHSEPTSGVRGGTSIDLEPRDGTELYDGDADISIVTDTFDVTPPGCVDAVVTERGRLDTAEIEEIAAEHAGLAQWE